MDVQELEIIISQGESSKVEFKESIDSSDQLAAEISAFANSLGGLLIVGISDEGETIGLSSDQIRRIQDLAMNVATNNIKPPLGTLWTEIAQIDNKNLLLIHIEKSLTMHRDKNHTVWVRSGPNKRKVFDNTEMARLMQEKRLIYAEQQIVERADFRDFDTGLFRSFYRNRFDQEIIDDQEIYRILDNLKLTVDHKLTLAALLLFGSNNNAVIPQFCIKAIWFPTNEFLTDKYLSSDNISGNIVEQYKKGKDFIVSKLNRPQRDKDFNSIGDLEIPELVIKELLINALFHRDYFIDDSIKLYLFPNRIEIKSPGRLPNNLTVEDIRQGIQRRDRNILITSYAIDLLPYRGIGSGILNSIKAYPHIDFENNTEGNYFRVIIHRPED